MAFRCDYDGDDCLLVAPRDAGQLAAACRHLLQYPGHHAAVMGEPATRKVRARKIWPSRIESYEAIFGPAAEDGPGQRSPPAGS